MTRVEYGIQYQREDGTWHQSIAGDLEQMATPAGALAALDRARDMYPDEAWRVVSRTVPDWEPADEGAMRSTTKDDGCCPACDGTGIDGSDWQTNGRCPDCYGTGHCHLMDNRGCEDQ